WVPNRVHSIGEEIADLSGGGKVATLTPLVPLEGGASIYEQLATGPFLWRVSDLLSSQDRKQMNILTQGQVDSLFQADPPRAILTGFEGQLEAPLTAYAAAHGYRQTRLSDGSTLWLLP
ncbi:MAG TPA: hypothetical protein VM409_08520, partial [Chloroflexia bacterium]|nr:hypothetical protein [Chloroflexia bacterium]